MANQFFLAHGYVQDALSSIAQVLLVCAKYALSQEEENCSHIYQASFLLGYSQQKQV